MPAVDTKIIITSAASAHTTIIMGMKPTFIRVGFAPLTPGLVSQTLMILHRIPVIITRHIYQLYQTFRKDTTKSVLDYQAYVQVCSEIIAEFEKIAPFKFYNGEDSVDLARESDARKELRSKIRQVDASIRAATETLENAISDLGDLTIDDVVTAYNEGKISSEERERLINSIECLQTIIQSHPQILEELKKGKIDLLNQLRDTY